MHQRVKQQGLIFAALFCVVSRCFALLDLVGVSVGNLHACVWDERNVYCWGSNEDGRCGNGIVNASEPAVLDSTKTPVILPERVKDVKVRQVSAGGAATCVLLENGELYTFGSNENGQLGQNLATGKGKFLGTKEELLANEPVQFKSGQKITRVSCNFDVSAALTDDNELYVWGKCSNGQCGSGVDVLNKPLSPVQLPVDANGSSPIIEDISCSDGFCGLTLRDGRLLTWGLQATDYRLGNGLAGNVRVLVPTAIPLSKNFTQIRTLSQGGCALASEEVYCWGINLDMQFGFRCGENIVGKSVTDMVNLEAATSGVRDLQVGFGNACAIFTNGDVKCVGRDHNGLIGFTKPPPGRNSCSSGGNWTETPKIQLPEQLAGVAPLALGLGGFGSTLGNGAIFVSGGSVACLLFSQRRMVCWGNADNAKLGYLSSENTQPGEIPLAPIQTVPQLERYAKVDDGATNAAPVDWKIVVGIVGGIVALGGLICGFIICWSKNSKKEREKEEKEGLWDLDRLLQKYYPCTGSESGNHVSKPSYQVFLSNRGGDRLQNKILATQIQDRLKYLKTNAFVDTNSLMPNSNLHRDSQGHIFCALSHCKVFVAIVDRTYFESKYCVAEFMASSKRLQEEESFRRVIFLTEKLDAFEALEKPKECKMSEEKFRDLHETIKGGIHFDMSKNMNSALEYVAASIKELLERKDPSDKTILGDDQLFPDPTKHPEFYRYLTKLSSRSTEPHAAVAEVLHVIDCEAIAEKDRDDVPNASTVANV